MDLHALLPLLFLAASASDLILETLQGMERERERKRERETEKEREREGERER
jgi:hypothetical protein